MYLNKKPKNSFRVNVSFTWCNHLWALGAENFFRHSTIRLFDECPIEYCQQTTIHSANNRFSIVPLSPIRNSPVSPALARHRKLYIELDEWQNCAADPHKPAPEHIDLTPATIKQVQPGRPFITGTYI